MRECCERRRSLLPVSSVLVIEIPVFSLHLALSLSLSSCQEIWPARSVKMNRSTHLGKLNYHDDACFALISSSSAKTNISGLTSTRRHQIHAVTLLDCPHPC